jgi:hypothetical protein
LVLLLQANEVCCTAMARIITKRTERSAPFTTQTGMSANKTAKADDFHLRMILVFTILGSVMDAAYRLKEEFLWKISERTS